MGWQMRIFHYSPRWIDQKIVLTESSAVEIQLVVYNTVQITKSVEKLVSLRKFHPILSILKLISLPVNIFIFSYDFLPTKML